MFKLYIDVISTKDKRAVVEVIKWVMGQDLIVVKHSTIYKPEVS